MRIKSFTLFSCAIFLSISCAAQFINNQSVRIEYDTRGNRILRELWTNAPVNKNSINNYEVDTLNTYGVTVFPNPFQVDFIILFPDEHRFNSFQVLDVSGKIVSSQEIEPRESSLSVGLPNLAPGYYSLRLISNGEIAVRKLIKY